MPHHYEQVRSSTSAVRRWREDEEFPSRGKLYLLCLTICIGGLQVVWATVMAQGSSYLISLDLQPSVVSLVWLAGPICGTLLQPYIAYKSDFCTHKWGRRRPFMIYGTIATIACINALSWTSEAVRLICNLLGVSDHGFGAKFVVQPVQASIRALIVDVCPGSQAAKANSFASIAVIIGSAIGYGCAFIEMPKGPAWLTNPQFKGLCFIASVSLGVTVAITSVMIEEKAIDIENDASEKSGLRKIWVEIYKAIRTLPQRSKQLWQSSFALGWLDEVQTLSEKMGPPSTKFYNGLRQQSIRHATLAMLVFSMVALVTNLCLPYLIINADCPSPSELEWQKGEQSTGAKSHIFMALRKRLVNRVTLPRVWMISHIIMAFALFGVTFGGDGFMTSVLFVSLLGFSWTLTQWAPFAMIATEIASSSITNLKSLETDTEDQSASLESIADLRPRAGITMAIHNIAIATPQMLSAVVGALIYWVCRQSHTGETDAMRWVLRTGIVAGLCAAWCARKL
ncbi:sucrose transporter [Botrytis cinerea]